MKLKITLIAFFSFVFSYSQIPTGYYSTATGTGYTLRTQLHNIISNGYIDNGYTPGLWITYQTSDRDNYYENDGRILDMYSENPTSQDATDFTYFLDQCGSSTSDPIAENECYNREHIIPQYFFTVGGIVQYPMYNDAHFVVPTDRYVNFRRDSFPIGKVGNNPTYISSNGSKLGPALNSGYAAGYSNTVFEPIDEFKGDIARMYFYFVTRYENVITTWGNSYGMFFASPPGNSTQIFTNAFKNILLTWHAQDPVSQREIARNNAIYLRQNNRNPFIDNPSYANTIWGATLDVPELDLMETITIYPNPSNTQNITIETEAIIDNIQLINTNGQLMMEVKNPSKIGNSYTLENLPDGFYFLKLNSENQSVIKKVIVN
jgi:endonuclease I